VPDFFSAANFGKASARAWRIVTSIAMFYDLDDPIRISLCDVAACWLRMDCGTFEQSYMPAMLRTVSYDTICHEHLEYYSLEVVKRILDRPPS